jgi:hypothetical protein
MTGKAGRSSGGETARRTGFFQKADGTPVIAIDCSQGSAFTIQETGTYELVVNNGVGPLSYHFVLQTGRQRW